MPESWRERDEEKKLYEKFANSHKFNKSNLLILRDNRLTKHFSQDGKLNCARRTKEKSLSNGC